MKKLKKWHKLAIAVITLAAGVHACSGKSEAWIRARSVKLSSPKGMCSGEQVRAPSGVDYILSAGHCSGLAVNGQMTVTDEDGNQLLRRVIAEDSSSDLLLIEGLPGLRGLDIASSEYASEHVRTFTHGSNLATHKTEGEIIEGKEVKVPLFLIANEEDANKCASAPKYSSMKIFDIIDVCMLDLYEAVTTASITPGSSGGMMVDDSGHLMGVASCSDETFGYFVSLKDIKRFLAGY